MLVAKHGKVILDQGYGMANRAAHIPNGPNTEYGLADATTTALITADTLQVSQRQKVYDWISNVNAPILCHAILVGRCPAKWHKITTAQLVEGTSSLPNYRWGTRGNNIVQAEAKCESLPLEPHHSVSVHYTTCANLIMAILNPGVVSQSDPTGVWMPTGLIPNGNGTWNRLRNHQDLVAKVPQLAHQMFDGISSSRLALDYNSSGAHVGQVYNDYFAAYSTPHDLYRYDNLLFSGTYMPPAQTRMAVAPRGITAPS